MTSTDFVSSQLKSSLDDYLKHNSSEPQTLEIKFGTYTPTNCLKTRIDTSCIKLLLETLQTQINPELLTPDYSKSYLYYYKNLQMSLIPGQRPNYYRIQNPLFQVPITNPCGKDLLILCKNKERIPSVDFPIVSEFHQVLIREALSYQFVHQPFLKLVIYNSKISDDTDDPNYEMKLLYYYNPKFQKNISTQNKQVQQIVLYLLNRGKTAFSP